MKGNDPIGDTPIFHFHDYGRKGKNNCQLAKSFTIIQLRQVTKNRQVPTRDAMTHFTVIALEDLFRSENPKRKIPCWLKCLKEKDECNFKNISPQWVK